MAGIRRVMLAASALLVVAVSAPSAMASSNGSWGCFTCEMSMSAIDPLVSYSCVNVLDGEWGDGIKCRVTNLGCDITGGACLYVVIGNGSEPGSLPLRAKGQHSSAETAKPIYLF
jgi:hypothetical protein